MALLVVRSKPMLRLVGARSGESYRPGAWSRVFQNSSVVAMRQFSRWSSVPLQRRWIVDALAVGRTMHIAGGGGPMNVAPAAEARRRKQPAISWDAIWIKAVALAAKERPELQTAYMPYPWAHFYVHPYPVAAVAVERMWNGEPAVFMEPMSDPAALSLFEIDQRCKALATLPIASVGSFRRLIRITRLLWILRRAIWHIAAYWSGSLRSSYLGTYTTMKSPRRIQVHQNTPNIPFAFHWSTPDPKGDLTVEILFDHRVVDAAGAVRVMLAVERAMNGAVAQELAGAP
jgi:hypothetical protein